MNCKSSLIGISLCLIIVGCSGSESRSYYGYVQLYPYSPQRAGFAQFEERSEQELQAWSDRAETVEDNCFGAQATSDAVPEQQGGISAGEEITITDGTSLISSFAWTNEFQESYYYLGGGVQFDEQSLPQGLTVNIPGDVFPAISSVPIPPAPKLLVNFPTSSDELSNEATIEWVNNWNSDSVGQSMIRVIVFGYDGSLPKSLQCTVVDDGYFELPIEDIAALGDDFRVMRILLARIVNQVTVSGNAVVQTSVLQDVQIP